jgi:hypothetical protein
MATEFCAARSRPSSRSEAKSVLGYAPRFGLIESLRDFADWMKSR